ncbi:hypothetical protein B0H16DRAFT_1746506 [Mycena metata]|uniref:Uncharacterized protein n=1 Tax=Mycena metata TaxID=1033252 RepID=A0AAD7GXG1_9AGAR|nr:hypothetical protein B0H16DRAFT_1746506 [Mycena metata]
MIPVGAMLASMWLAPATAPTPAAPETPRGSSFGDDSELPNDDNTDIFGNDDGSDWMAPENLGAMQDIFNPPTATEPLASLPPSSSHLGSLTPLTLWPKGMTAPTSPMTAGRAAQAERGGSVAAATYVSAIDPALLMQGTPPPPPRARGCFNGAAFAPNHPVGRLGCPTLAPGNGEARRLHICAVLPILFDTYRKITATSPVRAFCDQEAYRREVAARPRADIFALSPTTRPVFTLPTDATPGFFTSASSSAPTLLTPSSSSSTLPSSTTLPPAALPVSSMPAVLATPSASVPAPAATAPKPAVYNSCPMANPTKAAAKAAKVARRRAVPDDITNAIADAPLASSAPTKARSSAPVGENVQLCTARPGGVREMVRLEKEAGKRAKEREAEQRRLASRMHNPDGNHDLVCVPAPHRSGRESKGKAPPRPDEGYTGKVVNSTRGELGRRQGPQGVEIVPRGKRSIFFIL